MRDEVRVKVRGARQGIDVVALEKAASALVSLIRRSPDERWVIADLRLSSLVASARPVDLADDEVEDRFLSIASGLESLALDPTPPARWTDGMLQGLVTFGTVLPLYGVEGVELSLGDSEAVTITRVITENASAALQGGQSSLGSVEGVIDRFYDRDGHHLFGLRDVGGESVTVRFPRSEAERVRQCIGSRVVAWGELKRSPEGRKRELRMEGFELVPEPRGHVTVEDMIGHLGPEWTDGAGSVEWIRGQRDDD